MPDNGMGQMIQLLSTISDMQNRRRALDLEERRLEQDKGQAAQAFGFQEKSNEYKKFADFIDLAMRAPVEVRGNLESAAQAAGLTPQMAQAISALAMNAPKSIEDMKRQAVAQGMSQVNPGEVASAQMTGQNLGGQAQSGLQAILAGGAQQRVTPQMQQGFAQRAATGQNPLDALLGSVIMQNPQMMGRLAATTAGTQMTAAQAAQNAVGQAGVQAEYASIRQRGIQSEMEIAERLATARQTGMGMTPQIMVDAFGKVSELQKEVNDPKASQASRTSAKAAYNELVKLMGMPQLMYQDPNQGGPAGVMDRAGTAMTGPQSPNPPMTQGPPYNPGYQPPAQSFMQTPWNPLNNFVRPPQ